MTAAMTPRRPRAAHMRDRILSPVQRALLAGIMSLSVAILDRRMRKHFSARSRVNGGAVAD
jgi:hypothetical protein